jgi:hypothetical protein
MTRIFDHPLNQIHVLGHVYMDICFTKMEEGQM